MVRAGRELPMVKTMCIPEAWTNDGLMPQAWRDLSAYANAVMEPWDGPAPIAAFDGRWVLGGLARNGLRPMRYTVPRDGLLIAASQTGERKRGLFGQSWSASMDIGGRRINN